MGLLTQPWVSAGEEARKGSKLGRAISCSCITRSTVSDAAIVAETSDPYQVAALHSMVASASVA